MLPSLLEVVIFRYRQLRQWKQVSLYKDGKLARLISRQGRNMTLVLKWYSGKEWA